MTNLRDLLDSPFFGPYINHYKDMLEKIIEERRAINRSKKSGVRNG
nr:MAG TPA: hypothetical protein [Inoviridae sp.]